MSSSVFRDFPDLDRLLTPDSFNQGWAARRPHQGPGAFASSNLHIHTPFSFSAFKDIREAVSLAREQDVFVLGISDFNTVRGYEDFTEECQKAGVFPAYCMETIALSIDDQRAGVRWNDWYNPGAIYFCGKGLRYPAQFSQKTWDTLLRISQALEVRSRRMIELMNRHLESTVPGIKLDYTHIRDTITRGAVRERHVAKALALAITEKFPAVAERTRILKILYGKESQVDTSDDVAFQEELRWNLLKAGGAAFVEEEPEAYLSPEEAKSLMLDMGGIPCYPVLADGTKGELTEMEREPESLCDELLRWGVYCAEFIPTRNDMNLLRDYVSIFKRKGIVLTVGTEHNTPRMEPMVPRCRGGVELDKTLKEAFWKGACVVAAHQYLINMGQAGYVDASGQRTGEEIEKLEFVGKAVITYYLANSDV